MSKLLFCPLVPSTGCALHGFSAVVYGVDTTLGTGKRVIRLVYMVRGTCSVVGRRKVVKSGHVCSVLVWVYFCFFKYWTVDHCVTTPS
ncbi:hypothetical protein BDP27DRAFT_1309372, partial [Rhodocollybia butyracea]